METEHQNVFPLIMAGGISSRLTPYSSSIEPKQLLSIDSNQTLIQETIERISQNTNLQNIFVSTNEKLKDKISYQLPNISPENLIIEPENRDTLAALALNCLQIQIHNPNAIVASIPSDHSIENPDKFNQAFNQSIKIIQQNPNEIVFLGTKPNKPDTSFGYIKIKSTSNSTTGSSKIDSFEEKPDLKTAKKYLHDHNYFWNTGNYFFRADTLLNLINQNYPEISQTLVQIKENLITNNQEKIKQLYSTIPKMNIAQAIFSKPDFSQGTMINLQTNWADLGTWNSIYEFFHQNQKEYKKHPVKNFNLKNHNCLILNNTDKPVTTAGLKNILIVETPNGTIVANKNKLKTIDPLIRNFYSNPITTEISNNNCQIINTSEKPLLVVGLKNTKIEQNKNGLTIAKKSILEKLRSI